MFDVSWSDPTRETVGQRRSRKEHEQNTVTTGIQRSASTSSDSTSTKRRPSILTLLNSSKKDFPRPASQENVSARKEPVRDAHRSRVGEAVGGIPPIQELPAGTWTSEKHAERFVVTELPVTGDKDHYSPADDARLFKDYIRPSTADTRLEPAFTSWASRSASTDSSWSSMADSPQKSNFVQPLSPTSFVTQRTEITVASREDVKDNEQNITIVHISADGNTPTISQDLPPQLSPSFKSEFQVSELYPSEKSEDLSWLEDVMPRPSEAYAIGNMTVSNRWKPPENWECPSMLTPPPKSSARPAWRPDSAENSLPGSDLFQVQKSLRRMRTATPKIMLERLTEEWTADADASINEELEFESNLWMRTALHACVQSSMSEVGSGSHSRSPKDGSTSPKVVKILSLYEDHASLSLLSTIHPSPSSEIHHLSTVPFPAGTIYSLAVPSPKQHLPYGPQLFTSINASLTLPSLLPSSSLPPLLKECHRVLRKHSSLHLTLVDPCPVATSMGPKMRQWLDTHLVLELERRFRCLNPCRLVPGWLVDAGFAPCTPSGPSTVLQMRFAAATRTALAGSYDRGAAGGAEAEIREELRAVVGRRLWEECWGRFCVNADSAGASRWWDDGQVMEECAEMRTMWEILIVDAGKED